MGICRTAKIEEVVNDASAAVNQLKKLEEVIKAEEGRRNLEFTKRIDEFLDLAKVNDETFTQRNVYIKVEYASEFSLDKIVAVVETALQAAASTAIATQSGGLLSSDATSAYSKVIVAIGEAAKSSSKTTSNGSFSATRLAPGVIAFVYASSVTIEEIQTFGTEAITATAIHYALIESNQDFANWQDSSVEKLQINAALKAYKDFITLQVGLVDRLAKGEITLEQYVEVDKKYAKIAEELRERVQSAIDDVSQPEIQKSSFPFESSSIENQDSILNLRSTNNMDVVKHSIDLISGFGKRYEGVIKLNEERLSKNYF